MDRGLIDKETQKGLWKQLLRNCQVV